MIILSLIVKRSRIKALVKDKRAAMEAFGTYVEVGGGFKFSKITLNGPFIFIVLVSYLIFLVFFVLSTLILL